MAYDTSTPEGIRAGAEFVKAWFEAREVDVRHIDHHGLPVLIAESGPADGPVVILHGHIDVVPAFEHQFTPEIDGDRLVGRGAYKM